MLFFSMFWGEDDLSFFDQKVTPYLQEKETSLLIIHEMLFHFSR